MTDKPPVDKNECLVLAYFGSMEEAEKAVDAVKDWDTANEAVKLGAVGILTKENDKIKTHHSGRRTGRGATVGLGVGIIAGLLTGGIGLVGGAVGGSVLGGALGALFHKSLGLTEQELEEIGAHLNAGRAAVVVMCDDYEVEGVEADMVRFGGAVYSYVMSSEHLEETDRAVKETFGSASDTESTAQNQANAHN